MGNMFEMMKKAATMQKQMRTLQKQLASQVVEVENGGVTVVAQGDMTIKSVRIAPDALAKASPAGLERSILTAVNSALKSAKDMAGQEMAKMSGGIGGLADMLGGG